MATGRVSEKMARGSIDATIVGDINQLPEECISHVISLTTPRDACVSSAVSRTFLSAADSDATWQRFLPSDYSSVLSEAVDPVEYASKKELYFRLSDHHVLIHGRKMSFGLDKSSGAKCYMILARELFIVWGDDERYWRWIACHSWRFVEDAELKGVCWLEIRGKMDTKILTPCTAYTAYFVFKLKDNFINRRNNRSRGFRKSLQETKINLGGDIVSQHSVCLNPVERDIMNNLVEGEEIGENTVVPRERGDGWLEIEMGEFYSGDGVDGEVDMSLMEIKGGHWKHGLIVHGIEVRPKH